MYVYAWFGGVWAVMQVGVYGAAFLTFRYHDEVDFAGEGRCQSIDYLYHLELIYLHARVLHVVGGDQLIG
jgi:hypothetical protein